MKKRYFASLILIMITGALWFLFKIAGSSLFPAYRNFSKAAMSAIAAVSSVLPVALWDWGMIVLALAIIASLAVVIIKKKSFFNWLSFVLLFVSIALSEVICGWMLNHYAPSLSEEIGLEVGQYSVDELYETTRYMLEKADEYSAGIERQASGSAVKQDFYELAEIAGKSYSGLAKEYDVFKGSDKPVKKLSLYGNKLLRDGFVGIFMPLTAEPSVPENVPPVPLCYSMCHEAAHRLGISAEEEANFCAYLACINSEDSRFVYSGYYMAFSYCFSALYSADYDLAAKLYSEYKDSPVFQDRRDTAEIYAQYEGPHQEIHDKINDTYLKAFDEESGVKSYGEVVDYLIAYCKENSKESKKK